MHIEKWYWEGKVMEILGVAIIGFIAGFMVKGIRVKTNHTREEKRQALLRAQRLAKETQANRTPPPAPYKFSITRDNQGWRWEVLRLYYTWRGGSHYYETLNYKGGMEPVYGHAQTKDAAIEAGRAKCAEMTQIKQWRESREIYAL